MKKKTKKETKPKKNPRYFYPPSALAEINALEADNARAWARVMKLEARIQVVRDTLK